jgi:DNA-directed RNA polymerase specialized sigma24 family protein
MTAMLTITHPAPGRRSAVKNGLTPRRPTRVVENDEFAAFARRILAAHGRRIATGDIEGLRDLAALLAAWERATQAAVTGLRGEGFSWAEIGDRLDITRQAAQQRWGSPSTPFSSAQGQD